MSKKKRSQSTAEDPRSPIPATVAVIEDVASHRNRAIEVLESLGYALHEAKTMVSGRASLSSSPPDVFLIGAPEGGELVRECLEHDDRPVVIAAMAGPAESAYERCDELGADLFTLRPHNKDGLAAVLRAAIQLQLVRQRERALRGTQQRLHERLQQYGASEQATGFQHIDFIKSFLAMEIKRARRYGYSLAACLIGLDPWPENRGEPPADVIASVRAQIAAAITSAMRDIDMPVNLDDDRFLAFLPYSDLDGAERVGRRIAAAVRSLSPAHGAGVSYRPSVSVGVAALEAGEPVSLAKIMRDASMALRAAQLKGGSRIVVKR